MIYALDANHIASARNSMTPLDLQPLFMCHNDHMWLSRTVPCCIYTIPRHSAVAKTVTYNRNRYISVTNFMIGL